MNVSTSDKVFKERVNYVIEDGWFCAHAVNMPLVVQAKTFEQMKSRTKAIAIAWIKGMTKALNQDEPFEFVNEAEENKYNEE